MYCAAAPSYHDFLRHLFADGNARLLDVDYNISAQGVDYLYSAADDKSEIFEMLFYFRAAAYLLDDILFADLREPICLLSLFLPTAIDFNWYNLLYSANALFCFSLSL